MDAISPRIPASVLGRRGDEAVRDGTVTILVVDDEPDVRESVASLLEAGVPGVRVLTAVDTPHARRRLAEEPIDVLIADHYLPGVLGLDLIKESKRRQPDLRAAMLTGSTDIAVAAAALNEAGVEMLLLKPLRLPGDLELIRVVVDKVRRGRPARAFRGALGN